MIHVLAVAIAWAAFLALAVSMKRHQRDLVGRPLPERQASAARIAGWTCLAIAWTLEALAIGPALGTIVWVGETSLGGWLTVATIHWRANRARH